jgi:secondary thiamine-phosphate synthase enzyme
METVAIKTSAQTNMLNITPEIQRLIRKHGWKDGLITVFVPHTTAGVTINENADPDVVRDILFQIDKVIPFDDDYHHFEGNSPAHIKASLFGSSVTIILEHGRMMLGTWQGVYFCEFDGPRNRKFWVKFMRNGEQ